MGSNISSYPTQLLHWLHTRRLHGMTRTVNPVRMPVQTRHIDQGIRDDKKQESLLRNLEFLSYYIIIYKSIR